MEVNNTIKNIEISNEKNVSKEDILRESLEILKKVGNKVTLDDITNQHKDFFTTYPLVVRYMYDFKLFYIDVFSAYIDLIIKNPWKTEDEYLMMQSEYVSMLYLKKYNDPKKAEEIKVDIYRMMKKETDDFKKKVSDETRVEEERVAKLKKTNAEYLKYIHNDIPIAEKIIVGSDITNKKIVRTNITDKKIPGYVNNFSNLEEFLL